jgi:hypothetical protein
VTRQPRTTNDHRLPPTLLLLSTAIAPFVPLWPGRRLIQRQVTTGAASKCERSSVRFVGRTPRYCASHGESGRGRCHTNACRAGTDPRGSQGRTNAGAVRPLPTDPRPDRQATQTHRWAVAPVGDAVAGHSVGPVLRLALSASESEWQIRIRRRVRDLSKVALAENLVRAGQAACSYSWRMPPMRSRLRMFRRVSLSGSVTWAGNGYSGRAFAMPWCGRCPL